MNKKIQFHINKRKKEKECVAKKHDSKKLIPQNNKFIDFQLTRECSQKKYRIESGDGIYHQTYTYTHFFMSPAYKQLLYEEYNNIFLDIHKYHHIYRPITKDVIKCKYSYSRVREKEIIRRVVLRNRSQEWD